MVKEIDSYDEHKKIRARMDDNARRCSKVALEIFAEPRYQKLCALNTFEETINIYFAEPRSSVAVCLNTIWLKVQVNDSRAYSDARKMAEKLEKQFNRQVTLETTYPRDTKLLLEKQQLQQEAQKPSLLKRIFG